MRRPSGTGVVGAVLAVALAAVCVGAWVIYHRSDDSGSACAIPAAAPDKPVGTATAAPGGGGLRVAEQGFSNVYGQVSYGAIVENTSTSVAYRTRVTFDYSNNGKAIDLSSTRVEPVEIPIILPGQRIGVGGTGVIPVPHTATAVTLRFGATTWLTRDEAGRGLTPVTTAVTGTDHPNKKFPGYLSVNYGSHTTACRKLAARGVVTVVRNRSGAIIGGSLDSGDGCETGAHVISTLSPMPVAEDDARTQVYPYCDLQAPAGSPSSQLAN